MTLKSSVAVAVVLGLTAAADAAAAGASCRELHTGAADRVCRWPVGKGDFVDVYYGAPSPTAPPAEPLRPEPNYAEPSAEYAAPAYYYGYGLPFMLGADKAHGRDGRHGLEAMRGPRPGSSLTTVGPTPTFQGGPQGVIRSGGFRGHAGAWRR